MGYFWHNHGFLHDSIHEIPVGAPSLTDEEHETLLISQEQGQQIVTGPDGRPMAVTREATSEELQEMFTAAIQEYLDAFARTRNYDNILSAATYATSSVPKFRAEGQYAVEARDATWAKGYEILAEVESGQRPMPTLDDVLAELPVLVWPE